VAIMPTSMQTEGSRRISTGKSKFLGAGVQSPDAWLEYYEYNCYCMTGPDATHVHAAGPTLHVHTPVREIADHVR
jgi:hypothetical protein